MLSRRTRINKYVPRKGLTPLQEVASIELKQRKVRRQLIDLELEREKFLLIVRLTGASLYRTIVEQRHDKQPTEFQELARLEITKRELFARAE